MKIFLTGVTGFLGGDILISLCERNEISKIYCLVRAKDIAGAEKKLEKAFISRNKKWDREKVLPIVGDLMSDQLPDDLMANRDLSDVDIVVHSAANTSFLSQKSRIIEATNIGGASLVSKWASGIKSLKTFVYLGTAMIAGKSPGALNRIIYEHESPNINSTHIVHYTYSKMMGEIEVRKNIPKEKLLVVRPSAIIGDSRTWSPDSSDILWVLASINAMRLCPFDQFSACDLIASGYAVKAIIELIFAKRNFVTYHISTAENSTNFHKLGEVFQELDGNKPPFVFIPGDLLPEIKKWLRSGTNGNATLQECKLQLDYWSRDLGNKNMRILLMGLDKYFQFIELGQKFDNSRLLQDTGLSLPESGHVFIRRMWKSLINIDVVEGARNP